MGGLAHWSYEHGNIICTQQQALEASWSKKKPRNVPASSFVADEFLLLEQQVIELLEAEQPATTWLWEYSLGHSRMGDEEDVRAWAKEFVDVRNSAIHEGDPAKPINGDAKRMIELMDTADLAIRCTIRHIAALIRYSTKNPL